jgi:hypothetical protein
MKKFLALFVALIFLVPALVFGGGLKDIHHSTLAKVAIPPQASSDNTPVVGTIVDGLGFGGLEYIIQTGAQADNDATFTVLLEECDVSNCSDNAAVANANMLNTEAAVSWTTDVQANTVFMLGYTGGKRYTRMTITPASNSGANYFGAVAILGYPQYYPTQ